MIFIDVVDIVHKVNAIEYVSQIDVATIVVNIDTISDIGKINVEVVFLFVNKTMKYAIDSFAKK